MDPKIQGESMFLFCLTFKPDQFQMVEFKITLSTITSNALKN